MGCLDVVRLPVAAFRKNLETAEGKISLVIWSILGLFYFIYFIMSCIELERGTSGKSYRLWETVQDPPPFPQFIMCPEFFGDITAVECRILEHQTPNHPRNPLIIPTALGPGYLDHQGNNTCYGFNLDGKTAIRNHTVWCRANATGGWVNRRGNVRVFFDAPGTLDVFHCDQCVIGQDNFLMPSEHWTDIGLELEMFKDKPQYNVYPATYFINREDRNFTHGWQIESFFYWDSFTVWHYKPHHYYNFWQWIGFLGGTAFLLKLLHDISLGVTVALLFGVSENNRYEPVQ